MDYSKLLSIIRTLKRKWENREDSDDKIRRKRYGEFSTPEWVFDNYIYPEIKDKIYEYRFVDMFCGSGNLVLPILKHIPEKKRINYFRKHIFLFDIQEHLVFESILNAMSYGIPAEVAARNIKLRDSFRDYPKIDNMYHITNPPYCAGSFNGYPNAYQLAMMNDLKNNVENMIYIVPSNFLFGYSSMKKEFLKEYTIKKAVIFEKRIFDYTGTNVVILFLSRKKEAAHEVQRFEKIKINDKIATGECELCPEYDYRAGKEFYEFVSKNRANDLKIKFYLTMNEVERNYGDNKVELVDISSYTSSYKKIEAYVNDELYNKIKSNILFVKTIDTKNRGRIGLYTIKEYFGADSIVCRERGTTQPTPMFFIPNISIEDQLLIKDYFNYMIEYYRKKTDSEFLSTYLYSDGETRKCIGLSQVKALINTFRFS